MDKEVKYKGYLLSVGKVASMWHVWAYREGTNSPLEFIRAYPTSAEAMEKGKFLINKIKGGNNE